jgi:hypothetical protein
MGVSVQKYELTLVVKRPLATLTPPLNYAQPSYSEPYLSGMCLSAWLCMILSIQGLYDKSASIRKKQKHTTGGIPRWSPTLVLVARFSAYVWQSGRDAQFSLTYGRMYSSSMESTSCIAIDNVQQIQPCKEGSLHVLK